MDKISEFINRAEKLHKSGAGSPEFKKWKAEVSQYLKKIYGDTSNELTTFENIEYYNYYLTYDLLTGGWRENILKEKDLFEKGLKTAVYYLENFEADIIEQEERALEAEAEAEAEEAIKNGKSKSGKRKGKNKNIFIVQGKNDGVKKQVANFLLKTVAQPIVLNVDDRGIRMLSDTKDMYFEIDQEGKWQQDIAQKLKAMKLEMKKKTVRK